MKQTYINKTFIRISQYIIALILVLIPFHALLTVWASSLLGHYTLLRLWKEILILVLFVPALYFLFSKYNLKKLSKTSILIYLSIAYVLLSLVIGLIAYITHNVNLKALGYGLDINLRYIIFFWLCVYVSKNTSWLKDNWLSLLIIPGLIVIIFGLLEHYLLPADFLRHFGYGSSTIVPFQTVDSNNSYIRLQSTLRGANPLGAYLIIIVPAIFYKLYKSKDNLKRIFWGLSFVLSLVVMFYTYSRSAYIGLIISLFVLVWLLVSNKYRKLILTTSALLLILLSGTYLVFRDNQTFQDTFLHTSATSKSAKSSNQKHESATITGLKDVIHQPLGSGVGSAGPASVYNNHPARIAENYYVQIAQEVGIIGLALFVGILAATSLSLYENKQDSLSLILFVSLVGISFVNLLSHAWADDTLSLVWFGFAGIALSSKIFNDSFRLKSK